MSKKFLVAVDGSDHGWKALDLATALAKASDAEVIILHVISYVPMPEQFQQFAEIEGIAAADRTFRYHRDKSIGDAITSEAEARAQKKRTFSDYNAGCRRKSRQRDRRTGEIKRSRHGLFREPWRQRPEGPVDGQYLAQGYALCSLYLCCREMMARHNGFGLNRFISAHGNGIAMSASG